jgi:CheY-like chemotaxis protein
MELREAIVRVVTCIDQSSSSVTMIARDSSQRDRDPAQCLDILVAEDNLVIQKLAKRLLETRGRKVRLVSNGREAATALAEKDYDLVLMDIHTPELDWIAVTTLLREREKLTGTRQFVVGMTALAMKRDRERCMAAGMDGYLAKPIWGPELDDVLEGRMTQQSKSSKSAAPAEMARRSLGDMEKELVNTLNSLHLLCQETAS